MPPPQPSAELPRQPEEPRMGLKARLTAWLLAHSSEQPVNPASDGSSGENLHRPHPTTVPEERRGSQPTLRDEMNNVAEALRRSRKK
jgi:hypothetical protein